MRTNRVLISFPVLTVLLLLLLIVHLNSGSVNLPFGELLNALFRFEPDNSNHILAVEFRIPRAAMAILSGAGLSVCGMLMQTLFRNPLAGPYILGINSGASLAVATGILSGTAFLHSDVGIIGLSLTGAFLSGLLILGISGYVRSNVSLLLIGIMIGSFISALTALIQSVSTAESIKNFMMWGLGSLQMTEFQQLPVIGGVFAIGLMLTLTVTRALNALVLGEDAARSLGIRVKRIRLMLIVITALLAGLITAFCGPIAFVGMAIPNLTRMFLKTQDHRKLLWANVLAGAGFMLFCDILCMSAERMVHIPINVITSLIGAPFIVYIIFRRLA
ncbi:MAG: FecCD family ABC transporter permease [Bacteroidota bacterium]|jgi:iron complex transport system permease protein